MASRRVRVNRVARALVPDSRLTLRRPEYAKAIAADVVDAAGCPDLMGARDVADALGVKVPNIRKVSGLPEPETITSSGPVWLAEPVLKLAKDRTRKAAKSG